MQCNFDKPVTEHLSHLSICDGVVVDAHLWVDVFQVPAEAPALQPLPQGQALGDIPEIYPRVLSTNVAEQREENSKMFSQWLITVEPREHSL